MRLYKKPIDNIDEAEVLEASDSTPESSLFTPWFLCDKGFFRIYITIIGPKPKKPQGNLSLSRSEAEAMLKAITDRIKLLEKELRGQDSARR